MSEGLKPDLFSLVACIYGFSIAHLPLTYLLSLHHFLPVLDWLIPPPLHEESLLNLFRICRLSYIDHYQG